MGAEPPTAERRARGERRQVPRRKGDRLHRLLVRENWYRDVWLLVVSGFVLVAVLRSGDAVDDVKRARKVTVSIVCAATSATIDAGRATITGSSDARLPRDFERNLRRLGYPPRKVRRAAAERAARGYARIIAEAVSRQAGAPAKGVVNADGSLNCRKLQAISVGG